MAAEYFFSVDSFLSGNALPCTGIPLSIAKTTAHTSLIFFSGITGNLTYYASTPFNGGTNGTVSSDIPIFSQSLAGTGYLAPFNLSGVFAKIYPIVQGTGNIWAALARRS